LTRNAESLCFSPQNPQLASPAEKEAAAAKQEHHNHNDD
jgi:hypothetical protein